MYCLDTNIIIDYLRGEENTKIKLEKLFDLNLEVTTTTIALCEIYRRIFTLKDCEEELDLFERFIKNFNLISITKGAAITFGRLSSYLKKKGRTTEEIDLIIASIAIANNQILITKNRKHFENIPDLKLEVWS